MFRRSSSRKLSRSKSTSSAHSKHESIDPQIARQHAEVAAKLAYTRAQERSSTDKGHRRSQSRPRKDEASFERQQYSPPGDVSSNDRPVLRRQQSVRFAGPNAVPKKQFSNNRAGQAPIQHRASTATLRPVAITTSAPVPAAYRPPSRSSSIGRTSTGKPTAESFATALQAYDEYYTQEPEVPSTPSSYRRLRKSKSMFSPLKPAPHVFYTNGTPDRDTCSTFEVQDIMTESRTPQATERSVPLRAPKSMSFLRGGKGATRRANDEAVQMARDRFFHQATQERLRSQPSFIFRSRTQKPEKEFRKSVRSSSGNTDALPVGSAEQVINPKNSKLRVKARKASKTLKSTFKRVFGLSKDEPVEVPNQQVDARETHVRHYSSGPDLYDDAFVDIPYPEEQELSRVTSRVPSIRKAESAELLKSQAASLRSARSRKSEDSEEGSRVTSWTSTAVNTINSQAAREISEKERQRLSIINENGTHKSSASFKGVVSGNRISAYPSIRSHHTEHIEVINPLPPVDSARVYSALMKRIDENSPKPAPILSAKPSVDSIQAAKYAPRRSASVRRGRQPHKYPTIRHVPQEDGIDKIDTNKEDSVHTHNWVRAASVHSAQAEDVFGFTGTHTHQWVPADPLREARMRNEDTDDVFSGSDASVCHNIGRAMSNASRSMVSFEQTRNPTADRNLGRAMSNAARSIVSIDQPSNTTTFYTVLEENGRTPQEVALQNEPVIVEPNRIRESRSTFFGGTQITVSKKTSPYRKALAEGQNSVVNLGTDAEGTSIRASSLAGPLCLSSENVSTVVDHVEDVASLKAESESLYSRTTSGHTMAANSALSLLIDEQQRQYEMQSAHDSYTGDAVILDRVTYRPSMLASVSSHRNTSSNGSNEWKSWMSSEVAKLERAKDTRPSKPYVNYALPTMPRSFTAGHHVRENAQIDDEDVDVGERKAVAVKLPLGMVHSQNINVQQTAQPKPILKKPSQISLNENNDPRKFSIPTIPIPPPPPPPPIPARSPLRSTQSRASLRSVNTITPGNSSVNPSSVNGRNVLHKRNRSAATLRSTKSFQSFEPRTPAKLVKKRSRLTPSTTGPYSNGSAPTTIERHNFGTISTGSLTPGQYSKPGMRVNRVSEEDLDHIYGISGANLIGPPDLGELSESDAQALGSRKMVELFLSSRRRRIEGTATTGTGTGTGSEDESSNRGSARSGGGSGAFL
jgi:hypothetical protein